MLSVRQRRKQQGVCRKGFAQLKPAEPAQNRRADAVYQIPEIQREQQLFRPVQHIVYGLAVQLEEVARTEGKHHQMKGIVSKKTVHFKHVSLLYMPIDDKDDGKQIEDAHGVVFGFIGHGRLPLFRLNLFMGFCLHYIMFSHSVNVSAV